MTKPNSLPEMLFARGTHAVEVSAGALTIRPGRHTFADDDDLRGYLTQHFEGRSRDGGVVGLLSQKGTYLRQADDGSTAVTFGEPILDAITSADGRITIGNRTLDLRDNGTPNGITSVSIAAAPNLKFTGMVQGAERWASDDHSTVQYRLGRGKLTFRAWSHRNIVNWTMGAEVTVSDTNAKFQHADVRSIRFISTTAPCQQTDYDADEDRDGTYLSEYAWGVTAPQPERTMSCCRAQWHHAQFIDVVTAGSGCDAVTYDFDPGFPAEWTPITTAVNLNGAWTDGSARQAVISRNSNDLSVDMAAFNRVAAHGRVTGYDAITVTFPDAGTYTGELRGGNVIRWSNGSVWTKVVRELIDLSGAWTDGSGRRAMIFASNTALVVDMSDFDRPAATGTAIDTATVKVTFPDESTHTGTLQPPNRIRWDNGSAWTKL